MLNKVVDLTFAQARYIILKELDECGPIAHLLRKKNARLTEQFHELCEIVVKHRQWIDEHIEDMEAEMPAWDISKMQAFSFIAINEHLPHLILCNSELNWDDFISAWLVIYTEYIDVYNTLTQTFYNRHANNLLEDDDKIISMNRELLEAMSMSITGILNLLDIGMGYTQLIRSTDYLLKEISEYKHSNPNPVRLSRAYLESLGFNR